MPPAISSLDDIQKPQTPNPKEALMTALDRQLHAEDFSSFTPLSSLMVMAAAEQVILLDIGELF